MHKLAAIAVGSIIGIAIDVAVILIVGWVS